MDISNKIRSQILIDALPHIQKYHDKIVVVKYSGNAMTNAERDRASERGRHKGSSCSWRVA